MHNQFLAQILSSHIHLLVQGFFDYAKRALWAQFQKYLAVSLKSHYMYDLVITSKSGIRSPDVRSMIRSGDNF